MLVTLGDRGDPHCVGRYVHGDSHAAYRRHHDTSPSTLPPEPRPRHWCRPGPVTVRLRRPASRRRARRRRRRSRPRARRPRPRRPRPSTTPTTTTSTTRTVQPAAELLDSQGAPAGLHRAEWRRATKDLQGNGHQERSTTTTTTAKKTHRSRRLRPVQGRGADAGESDVLVRAAGAGAAGRSELLHRRFQIPPFLLPIYQAAGIEYDVPWQVLAAINEIETDYGRNLSVSSAGAVGWMQFMPVDVEAVRGRRDRLRVRRSVQPGRRDLRRRPLPARGGRVEEPRRRRSSPTTTRGGTCSRCCCARS